jgi:hypothetical protein
LVDCGRGSFELTGLKTESAIGRPVLEALELRFTDGVDYVATALEFEAKVAGKPASIGGSEIATTVDMFPAYDDDEGGLLVVLTPSNLR